MRNQRWLAASLLLVTGSACVGPLPSGVKVHPQGLLPSQDTATTPSGFIELEATGSRGDTERLATVAVRYGLAERTEIFFLQDLHKTIVDPLGPDPSGLGDAWLGLRHRLINADSSGAAHAFAAEVRLPHGDPDDGLGTGQLELHLTHIRDSSWRGIDVTTNTALWLIGDGEERADPALSGSLTLTPPMASIGGKALPFGFLGEVGGLWHPEERSSPAWVALGVRLPLHASLELQLARLEGIGGDGPEGYWALNIGRLVGDTLDFRSR